MSWTRTDRVREERPAPFIVSEPTLREAAGELAQLAQTWGNFTGRLNGGTMHAKELIDLGEVIEKRAGRAVQRAHRLVTDGTPAGIALTGDQLAGAWHALSAKLISDELRSEWLRMHSGRRPKRAELRALALAFEQLDAAVSDAIAHVAPAAMPAAARAAVRALAEPLRRRS